MFTVYSAAFVAIYRHSQFYMRYLIKAALFLCFSCWNAYSLLFFNHYASYVECLLIDLLFISIVDVRTLSEF